MVKMSNVFSDLRCKNVKNQYVKMLVCQGVRELGWYGIMILGSWGVGALGIEC